MSYTPCYRGFDSFYGIFNGQGDYYTHKVADGLDYWNQTKDYLVPIWDKNGVYSMVTQLNYLICY